MSARVRCVAAAGVLALLAALAGCGLGAGPVPTAVQLTVTNGFGSRLLHQSGPLKLVGQETVMSLLMRNYAVTTRYGGGFVESINGLSGGQEDGDPVDWFYYVNGVQASKGAAATNVHPGDHVWWDRHDWSAAENIPAVVGSYPEPFVNGYGGKRYPVQIECASVGSPPCRKVTARLRAAGVPAAIAAIGSGGEPEVLQVLVGPWRSVASDAAAQSIEQGPRISGVYARFSANGTTLTLLDRRAHTVRVLSSGAGLVAAIREEEDAPTWVITGTDEAGVQRAAEALQQVTLENHFAVAVAAQGEIPVPVVEE